jgi:hypothetical protein
MRTRGSPPPPDAGVLWMNRDMLRHRLLPALDLNDDFRLTAGQVRSTDTPANSCPPGVRVGAPICTPLAALTTVQRGHPCPAHAATMQTAKGRAFVKCAVAHWQAFVRSVEISPGRAPLFAINVAHR